MTPRLALSADELNILMDVLSDHISEIIESDCGVDANAKAQRLTEYHTALAIYTRLEALSQDFISKRTLTESRPTYHIKQVSSK